MMYACMRLLSSQMISARDALVTRCFFGRHDGTMPLLLRKRTFVYHTPNGFTKPPYTCNSVETSARPYFFYRIYDIMFQTLLQKRVTGTGWFESLKHVITTIGDTDRNTASSTHKNDYGIFVYDYVWKGRYLGVVVKSKNAPLSYVYPSRPDMYFAAAAFYMNSDLSRFVSRFSACFTQDTSYISKQTDTDDKRAPNVSMCDTFDGVNKDVSSPPLDDMPLSFQDFILLGKAYGYIDDACVMRSVLSRVDDQRLHVIDLRFFQEFVVSHENADFTGMKFFRNK